MVQLSGTLGQLRDLHDVKINTIRIISKKYLPPAVRAASWFLQTLRVLIKFLNGGECSDSGNEGQGDKESEDRD